MRGLSILWGSKLTSSKKFMQIIEDPPYKQLKKIAKARGISLQDLLRASVIPEWLGRGERVIILRSVLRKAKKRRVRGR